MQPRVSFSFIGQGLDLVSTLPSNFSEHFNVQVIAALSGAPDGSTLHVAIEGGLIGIQVRHSALEDMRRQIIFRESGGICVVNQRVRIRKEAQGTRFLARSLDSQVRAVDTLQLHPSLRVRALDSQVARRSSDEDRTQDEIGYFLLPRIGFNADIPNLSVYREQFPECRATLLSDLMESSAKRDWWLHTGHAYSFGLSFDLAASSLSRKILDTYMRSTS